MTQPQVEIGCHELPGKAARGGGRQSFAVGLSGVIPLHKLMIHFLQETKLHVFSLPVREENINKDIES